MRIMIADDDPSILKMLKIRMEKMGHEVYTYTSGFGVVNGVAGRSEHPKPDVVILDNYMPALSGLALLELLKKNAATSDVPVVLYSADPNLGPDVDDVQHPYCTFLPKGGSMRPLIDLLLSLHS